MNTTPKEDAVIIAIARSEYRSGTSDVALKEPVWSFDLDSPTVHLSSVAGVISSLQSKGLVECAGVGKDSTVELTDAGIARYRVLASLNKF